MQSRFDRPELDATRFFAFCAVFCHHFTLDYRRWGIIHDTGAYGMSLFFMMSAYLIVTLLIKEQRTTGTISIGAFFIRRALRIWPLYFLMLAFAVLLGHFYEPGRIPPSALTALAFGLGNVWVAHHGWALKWMQPLWSLSVEEQFYVGIPSLVKIVRRSVLIAFFLAVIAFSYATLVWLAPRGATPMVEVWVNSFVEFQFFAAGGLLALWHAGREIRLGGAARLALIGTGLALWVVAVHVCKLQDWHPISWQKLVVGYACVLIGTLALFVGVLDTTLTIPPVVRYLGKITYGLYVFHALFLWLFLDQWRRYIPLPNGGRVILAGLATVAMAMVSYQFFERPFLTLKYRFERVHSRPA
jgi:peptidoglycan/LPS O-acetylase OafA/YrhL